MNIKMFKPYKVLKDSENKYITILTKAKWMIPVLEFVYGLGSSKYGKYGPVHDSSMYFNYWVTYKRRVSI